MADIYQALAHPIRREILGILRVKPRSAGELATSFSIAKPTLSGHLNILKECQLIDVERRGTTLIYSINLSVAEEALSGLMSLFRVGHEAPVTTDKKLSE